MQNTLHYDFIIRKLRQFFQEKKGFVEVPSQSRTSILAACEDPKTVTQFQVGGVQYPLPQTGQMWLEHEWLKNPLWKGVFCISTSYRDEPAIIEGRHQRIFPMFEFEAPGDVNILKELEKELLIFLGLKGPVSVSYEDACEQYGVSCLEAAEENLLLRDFGPVISLEQFPRRSQPFWNMKHNHDTIYNKIDIILYGMETIGSAERSTNVEEMRDQFFSVSDGDYAELLFSKFGKDRVLYELNHYFSLPFVPRFGGGIGITRLEHAFQKAGLFDIQELPVKVASSFSHVSF